MTALLAQLKLWRNRWDPKPRENDDDLNRAFTSINTQALDYLIETYLKPVEFIGAPNQIILAERNGAQKVVVDILSRVDIGMHPMLYKPEVSSKDDEPVDVRQ